LDPRPEFVMFAGDEIVGLTADEAELRDQWRHWLHVEMAWLDRSSVPLYNSTSNHTTYDTMSERVFADVLDHLPRNGPPDQRGLSYSVRRDDLLIVFVNTCWSGLGGEGHVETDWLDEVLGRHRDARHKLVVGHHPAFPVNGFSGEYQREIGRSDRDRFWETLVRNEVAAYLCSHILAFDVQVHRGVLQVVSAGAGTAHRMPAETEYLHCVQATIDEAGRRYQVVDRAGKVRERLTWPPSPAPSGHWQPLPVEDGDDAISFPDPAEPNRADPGLDPAEPDPDTMVALRIAGTTAADEDGRPQTLLAALPTGGALSGLWIGLTGTDQRLTVTVSPQAGRSPHYWFGPTFEPGRAFETQIALHPGMGPGGIMHRADDGSPWSSLTSSSPWGLERLAWPARWTVGHTGGPTASARFRGTGLSIDHHG
ncbi:MAG: metallophosphoesterase family protein, partial [Acidimicrobiales bacterium]